MARSSSSSFARLAPESVGRGKYAAIRRCRSSRENRKTMLGEPDGKPGKELDLKRGTLKDVDSERRAVWPSALWDSTNWF